MSGMKRGRHKVADAAGDDAVTALRHARLQADADRMDAVRARVDAEDRRHLALKNEDEAALARIDDEIASARRRIDIAEAKFNRLDADLHQAEYNVEQARRHAIRDEAQRALAEARRVMREEYPIAAQGVVDVLRRARDLQEVARRANLEPPDDVHSLSLIVDPTHDADGASRMPPAMEWRKVLVHRETGQRAPPEMFSSPDHELREILVPKPLEDPFAPTHKAIADFVNLPGVEPGKYFYGAIRWGQAR